MGLFSRLLRFWQEGLQLKGTAVFRCFRSLAHRRNSARVSDGTQGLIDPLAAFFQNALWTPRLPVEAFEIMEPIRTQNFADFQKKIESGPGQVPAAGFELVELLEGGLFIQGLVFNDIFEFKPLDFQVAFLTDELTPVFDVHRIELIDFPIV